MKIKIILFSAFLFAFSALKAQTPLTTAPDFTVTDSYGNTIHLFEILDRGQYVLIDFFFTTCEPCKDLVPGVVANYSRYGCNQHDVFFMEVTPRDTDEECHAWEEEYGIQYPTVGKDGESRTITNGYEIDVYPTMILIAPNRQIIKQDIYPSTAIPAAFEIAGIREFDCITSVEESQTSIHKTVSIYPNPAENQLTVNYHGVLNSEAVLEIYDITGSLLIRQTAKETNEVNISHLANGLYLVKLGDEVKKFIKR